MVDVKPEMNAEERIVELKMRWFTQGIIGIVGFSIVLCLALLFVPNDGCPPWKEKELRGIIEMGHVESYERTWGLVQGCKIVWKDTNDCMVKCVMKHKQLTGQRCEDLCKGKVAPVNLD